MLAMVLAALVGLAACNRPATQLTPVSASPPGKAGSSDISMRMDDALITSEVQAALAAAADINGKDIQVSTREGEVTLSGSVPARQIERAEEVARNVDGVRDVNNRLKPIGVMA